MNEVLEKIDELAEDAYDLLKEIYKTTVFGISATDNKNIEEAMYKVEGIHDVIFMYQDAMRELRRKL